MKFRRQIALRLSSSAPTVIFFFFFNDPATPEISPLPLHAALPILRAFEEQGARESTPRGGRGKIARTATPPSCLADSDYVEPRVHRGRRKADHAAQAEGEPAGAGRLEDVDVESRAGVQRAAQVHLCAGARRWHQWERQRKVERVLRGERCELLSVTT